MAWFRRKRSHAKSRQTRSEATVHAWEVERRYAEQLMSWPGVVSVGIGTTGEGEVAIVVGLESDDPRAREAMPASLEGVKVATEVVGTLTASEREAGSGGQRGGRGPAEGSSA